MSDTDSMPFEAIIEMRRAISLLESLNELVPVDCPSHLLLNLTTDQILSAYLDLMIEINLLAKQRPSPSSSESRGPTAPNLKLAH